MCVASAQLDSQMGWNTLISLYPQYTAKKKRKGRMKKVKMLWIKFCMIL